MWDSVAAAVGKLYVSAMSSPSSSSVLTRDESALVFFERRSDHVNVDTSGRINGRSAPPRSFSPARFFSSYRCRSSSSSTLTESYELCVRRDPRFPNRLHRPMYDISELFLRDGTPDPAKLSPSTCRSTSSER